MRLYLKITGKLYPEVIIFLPPNGAFKVFCGKSCEERKNITATGIDLLSYLPPFHSSLIIKKS
jgi:hypothetical protein